MSPCDLPQTHYEDFVESGADPGSDDEDSQTSEDEELDSLDEDMGEYDEESESEGEELQQQEEEIPPVVAPLFPAEWVERVLNLQRLGRIPDGGVIYHSVYGDFEYPPLSSPDEF